MAIEEYSRLKQIIFCSVTEQKDCVVFLRRSLNALHWLLGDLCWLAVSQPLKRSKPWAMAREVEF